LFYFDEKVRLTNKSESDAKKMPQQVEMVIKVIDQFLDVAIHGKSGVEWLRGFIQAPVAFRNFYIVHFWVGRGLFRIKLVHLLINLHTISRSYALFSFF